MKKTPTKAITKTFAKTPTKSRLKSKGKHKLYHLGDEDSNQKKKLTLVICPNCSHHFKAPPAPPQPQLQHISLSQIQGPDVLPVQMQQGSALHDSIVSRSSLKPLREIMDLKGLEKLKWLNEISMSQRSRKSQSPEGLSSSPSPSPRTSLSPPKVESARKDPVVQPFTAPQKSSSLQLQSVEVQKGTQALGKGAVDEIQRQIYGRYECQYLLNSLLEWVTAVEGLQTLPSFLSVMVRQYIRFREEC